MLIRYFTPQMRIEFEILSCCCYRYWPWYSDINRYYTTQKFICVMHVSSDNIDSLPINARVWGGCDAGVTLSIGCRSIAANPHNQQNRSRVSLAPARPCCVPLARDNRGWAQFYWPAPASGTQICPISDSDLKPSDRFSNSRCDWSNKDTVADLWRRTPAGIVSSCCQ